MLIASDGLLKHGHELPVVAQAREGGALEALGDQAGVDLGEAEPYESLMRRMVRIMDEIEEILDRS